MMVQVVCAAEVRMGEMANFMKIAIELNRTE